MSDYEDAVAEAKRLGLMTVTDHATDRCQCPSCGEVFSTEANFDAHLRPAAIRLAEGYEGSWCRSPAEVGLVRSTSGSGPGTWHLPGPEGRPWEPS